MSDNCFKNVSIVQISPRSSEFTHYFVKRSHGDLFHAKFLRLKVKPHARNPPDSSQIYWKIEAPSTPLHHLPAAPTSSRQRQLKRKQTLLLHRRRLQRKPLPRLLYILSVPTADRFVTFFEGCPDGLLSVCVAGIKIGSIGRISTIPWME